MIKQNIRINMKKVIRLIGGAAAWAMFMVVFVTFMGVYFGIWAGIDINGYGEANFEFVLLSILFPMVSYAFIYNTNDICQEGRV